MTSISDVIAVATMLIMSLAISTTNGMPAPIMTPSTRLHQHDTVLYRDMELRTHILAQMTKELGANFSSYFDLIEDAGPCTQNSSVDRMRTLLETVHTSNSTVVQSTTAMVLSKMVRILLSLETKKDTYSDRIVFLRDLTTETSSAYVALTGNQTIPEVAFGMICQGSGTWTEVLSILNEFKTMFDLMNALFRSH